ncbi:MAG: glycine--tRNA ligase subunit beta [Anaerolineae bacterium]|nr:glycine--tRNA ligase subunit beta [Anaerolineae bacterium]
MSRPLTFQEVVLRLQEFWAQRGCLLWQPYSEKVGAGTMNPATVLRVLGPEPWNVAYVEPSYRPDDGRYGENPNRMQMHIQYQVILKPDPGNPQEIYLQSLEALGIRREEHDIRFVEDNWESPALGAWGLGWEVWLDGLEITQFTYFQQSGGLVLDPPAVEITYGLERITMFLQRVRSVWEIDWDGVHTYGDVLLTPEIEHCHYNFEVADIESLRRMYDLYENEARRCLEAGLVIPAHDYILRCSHTFNLLDSRGAVGVTERAVFFRRMRDLARQVAQAYVAQRERAGFPWLARAPRREIRPESAPLPSAPSGPATFLLEIGTEELPAGDLSLALAQLREQVPALLAEARLDYETLRVLGTPRRLAVLVEGLAPRQRPREEIVKGPPVRAAFDAEGRPTPAAEGFARRQGVTLSDLQVRELDGGQYIVAVRRVEGRPAPEVLAELLPRLIAGLRFPMSMRWNETGVAFSRPIRWLVALLGDAIIPFEYAGLTSGRTTRGSRPEGSPDLSLARADDYLDLMRAHAILADPDERRAVIAARAAELAASVGGRIPDDPDLLEEVTNLVEQPTPFLGRFEEAYLRLPREVLVAVMKKHQRYFPVLGDDGRLLPYFIAVRNGGEEHLEIVRQGNEEVLRARFADADYFYREDTARPLESFLPRLATLTFQEHLGSMLDKARRLEALVPEIARMLGLSEKETAVAQRAAHLCKADLATQMVVEFTSLQGVMGREYALKSGELPEVAEAILEHYLPRFAGDALPKSLPGLALGLADRLDSLAGLFAVGLVPTGSADPYGLRRDALGMVLALIGACQPFSIRAGLEAAARLLPVRADPAALEAALDFVVGRLRVYLREQGFRHDVVEAVLAARGDDPYRALLAVEELSRWVAREDWPRILDNYARCVRITRDFAQRFTVDPARFVHPIEAELYRAWQEARSQVTPQSTVDEFLNAFLPLVEVIDRFFARETGVMVMAEDPALRENRLALLQSIVALAEGIVDLSRLEGF